MGHLKDIEQCFKMLKLLRKELTYELWGIAVKFLEVTEN